MEENSEQISLHSLECVLLVSLVSSEFQLACSQGMPSLLSGVVSDAAEGGHSRQRAASSGASRQC